MRNVNGKLINCFVLKKLALITKKLRSLLVKLLRGNMFVEKQANEYA